ETIQRFVPNFVWYRAGGEPVGRFRAELYAGDVLSSTFDYVVGTQPVAIPTPVVVATPSVAPSETALPSSMPISLPALTPVPAPATPAPAAPPPPRPVPVPVPASQPAP